MSQQIALTTIRRIGSRAHPLTVVNYFAWLVMLVATILGIIKRVKWPTSFKAWGYMTIIGVFGGLMVCFGRDAKGHGENCEDLRTDQYGIRNPY